MFGVKERFSIKKEKNVYNSWKEFLVKMPKGFFCFRKQLTGCCKVVETIMGHGGRGSDVNAIRNLRINKMVYFSNKN